MLSAIKLLSVNPWVVVGVLVTLAAAAVSIFFYGVNVGSTSAQLACEKRVAGIMEEIDRQNKAIEREHQAWERAIALVQETYNKDLAEAEVENNELERKVNEYEVATRNDPDACRPIDRRDLDGLRK